MLRAGLVVVMGVVLEVEGVVHLVLVEGHLLLLRRLLWWLRLLLLELVVVGLMMVMMEVVMVVVVDGQVVVEGVGGNDGPGGIELAGARGGRAPLLAPGRVGAPRGAAGLAGRLEGVLLARVLPPLGLLHGACCCSGGCSGVCCCCFQRWSCLRLGHASC